MFPSARVALSGLENDQNYCVLLEMVPVADCRFKFSGSQWVPAGGAEPQSLQNIYIHPDSPALGSHWQAQPINFNKTKLTNNTLDSSGHVSFCVISSADFHRNNDRVLETENSVNERITDYSNIFYVSSTIVEKSQTIDPWLFGIFVFNNFESKNKQLNEHFVFVLIL